MTNTSVIFDLDGTMIDTAPDLIATTNYTLGIFGMEPVGEEIIEPAVGLGAKAMLHAAMLSLGREPKKDELDEMLEHFIGYYSDNIAVRSAPFPGLEDALKVLRGEGALLGICTNKRERLAVKLMKTLELDHYFAAIAGADTFPVRKPDRGHLLGTIEAVGGSPQRSVMIGDSLADAKAAQSAGVPFIAVSFGYGEPVERLKPDAVIGHFDELAGAVTTLLSKGRG
ncbi:MAG: HAD family hydrolase [Rhodomicrobiaceae bacterium]